MKKIAIFGGASCTDTSYYYPIAYQTGKLLAESGFVTITGAGPGMMEEGLRGAHQAGGKTIGVALNIKERKKSDFLHEEFVFDTLNPRQDHLISMADAYVAVPGGIGTLYEILAVLALKRLDEIPKEKPLILVDEYFTPLARLFQEMLGKGFVESSLDSLYSIAKTPNEALAILHKHFN